MTEIRRLLNQIEHKELVLPEFQREFTWNKDQAKKLVGSFLKDYPTGSLLFWKTSEEIALKNMPDFEFDERVEVILDGQQRLTTLYLLIEDEIPPYYGDKDIGKGQDIRNLYYNLETGVLEYYVKTKMKNDPRWVSVKDCFKNDVVDDVEIADKICEEEGGDFKSYLKTIRKNLQKMKEISGKEYPILYVKDSCSLRESLVVFDRINSQGTPLSKADIALAHMVSRWPETRRVFKEKIRELEDQGFSFDLTFFVRAMNAVINNRAEYKLLHKNTQEELKKGFEELSEILDYLVNILKDRAYIYGTSDLNTPYVLIPIIGYLSIYGPEFPDEKSLKKGLHWMYAALYKRRYTSSVTTTLEADLNCLKRDYTPEVHPFDDLLVSLKEDEGDSKVTKHGLASRGVGHPLYNMTTIVIRANEGVDWANGIKLSQPYGEKYNIERHHIFPKSALDREGYDTGSLQHSRMVHEIANRVPLTKGSNMEIFDKKPEEYLPVIQEKYPGNLEKFFIPINEKLWKMENFEQFLERRRELIANGINDFMESLISDYSSHANREEASDLIEKEESEDLEFKASLAWNIHSDMYTEKSLEKEVLKTITAFLNTDGGTLLIGIEDNGEVFGIDKDVEKYGSLDDFELHLSNLIKDQIGRTYEPYVHISFSEIENETICRLDVEHSPKPAFMKGENDEIFYIRGGNHSEELMMSEAKQYIDEHWE